MSSEPLETRKMQCRNSNCPPERRENTRFSFHCYSDPHLQGNVIQLIGTWGCALRFFHLLQSCLNGKLEGIPKHRRSIEKGPCGAHWSR